ncbi:hypothetical protein HYU16_02520 [Candidatus Woesearchaeota archaeon]|nr:hypothetical protein [Candidatus Woesearchaeota archaeon]
MLQEKQFKRDAAQKASINEILQGAFELAEDGTTVLNTGNRQIKRVNILATVVAKNESQEGEGWEDAVVDDGTGQIRLRFFDNEAMLKKLAVGDFTAIIGRPRHYGGETYIAPEVLKPANNVKWAEVRKLELLMQAKAQSYAGNEKTVVKAAGKNREGMQDRDLDGIDYVSKGKIEIYRIIKELDTGRGADISAVAIKFTEKFSGGNAELLISEMTKAGDLFEVLPGRLKVLE